jgi:hypothetical protein
MRTHKEELYVNIRPRSGDEASIPLSNLSSDLSSWNYELYGVQLIEVPLLVLKETRHEFDHASQQVEFNQFGPLESLGMLATTQTGFLPKHAPDYRFPGPLQTITDLCHQAGAHYARHDEAEFRAWLTMVSTTFATSVVDTDEIYSYATKLPQERQKMLMVPLILMSHMWRQGSPVLAPATGPSAMPKPLHELLITLSEATGIIPRFNQILMTMLAWKLDGKSDGDLLSHRDVTSLEQMSPYFWLMNQNNQSELDLNRAFFAMEAFGVPIYGWSCFALECAAQNNLKGAVQALKMIWAAMKNVYTTTKTLMPRIDADEFRKLQVTGGWIEDEVTAVASGYQLPFMLMLDALFQVNFSHPGVIAAKQNNLRFVPQHWQEFFHMIRSHCPSLKDWIQEKNNSELTEAYTDCVQLFALFRSMHKYVGGQVIKGATTTGRKFDSPDENYMQFMEEMEALVNDTTAAADFFKG